eukprot:GHVO01022656.1.p1 GENE.GHVO01022656.1~~GHVO01022656.1.p1  ORF type:complete len:186 (+),score=39.19 GHVO01022656.1:181-738(+)
MSLIGVEILGYRTADDGYTEYRVLLTEDGLSREVSKRYSQFREMHEYLKERYAVAASQNFPPKLFWGNTSVGALSRREVGLQSYLSAVLADPNISADDTVRSFLDLGGKKNDTDTVGSAKADEWSIGGGNNGDLLSDPSVIDKFISTAKSKMLDLAQPVEQLLNPLEREEREMIYQQMLLDDGGI